MRMGIEEDWEGEEKRNNGKEERRNDGREYWVRRNDGRLGKEVRGGGRDRRLGEKREGRKEEENRSEEEKSIV